MKEGGVAEMEAILCDKVVRITRVRVRVGCRVQGIGYRVIGAGCRIYRV